MLRKLGQRKGAILLLSAVCWCLSSRGHDFWPSGCSPSKRISSANTASNLQLLVQKAVRATIWIVLYGSMIMNNPSPHPWNMMKHLPLASDWPLGFVPPAGVAPAPTPPLQWSPMLVTWIKLLGCGTMWRWKICKRLIFPHKKSFYLSLHAFFCSTKDPREYFNSQIVCR